MDGRSRSRSRSYSRSRSRSRSRSPSRDRRSRSRSHDSRDSRGSNEFESYHVGTVDPKEPTAEDDRKPATKPAAKRSKKSSSSSSGSSKPSSSGSSKSSSSKAKAKAQPRYRAEREKRGIKYDSKGKPMGFGGFYLRPFGEYSHEEFVTAQGGEARVRPVDLLPEDARKHRDNDDDSQKPSDWYGRTKVHPTFDHSC